MKPKVLLIGGSTKEIRLGSDQEELTVMQVEDKNGKNGDAGAF